MADPIWEFDPTSGRSGRIGDTRSAGGWFGDGVDQGAQPGWPGSSPGPCAPGACPGGGGVERERVAVAGPAVGAPEEDAAREEPVGVGDQAVAAVFFVFFDVGLAVDSPGGDALAGFYSAAERGDHESLGQCRAGEQADACRDDGRRGRRAMSRGRRGMRRRSGCRWRWSAGRRRCAASRVRRLGCGGRICSRARPARVASTVTLTRRCEARASRSATSVRRVLRGAR